MYSLLKNKASALKLALHYRHLGLESSDFNCSSLRSEPEIWAAEPAQHVQAVSPGRSGTRWLASLLTELTNAFVCHAKPATLAEPGYLLDKGLISDAEYLGAYRCSRSEFLGLSQNSNRLYIDLDCKNSPAVHILTGHYPACRFLIMLRDPISFVRSGVSRGYFINKNPQVWGHLESIDVDDSLPIEEWQLYKIAAFWRRIALYADQTLLHGTSKTYVLNVQKMFSTASEVSNLFSWLDLPFVAIQRSKNFGKKLNRSKRIVSLSSSQELILRSDRFKEFCCGDLSKSLLESSGINP
jgi:hypothetical protein